LFTSVVKQQPHHPAIVSASDTLSYQELADRSQEIARILLASGLQKGDVVVITGRMCPVFIAGMMGILLSGGVLLTLDQNLPEKRQQLMVQSAQASYLLHIGPDTERRWSRDSLSVIELNTKSGHSLASSQSSLSSNDLAIVLPTILPDDSAYIFFTSGTSGVPKGVLGVHKGLSHFLHWQRNTFHVDTEDRVAQLTGLSFDVILREAFLPLSSGATLCLPDEGLKLDPVQLMQWLHQERITLFHTVPTLAASWLAEITGLVMLPSLRVTFFAGEPLNGVLLQRWFNVFPEIDQVVNLYGPTETTLAKCFLIITRDSIDPGIQPIGVPLPSTQALILNSEKQLCGLYEPGEIVLRTPFRSKGYINNVEEQEKRFTSNPFSADPLDLLYHTGDLGRYRSDGSLEILGRIDQQIKIRGIRIEPYEVQAVLARHPDVQECFVLAQKEAQGGATLIGYVVPKQASPPLASELRRYMKELLPAYMVPASFVILQSLPLTPNGKIDRSALPCPDRLQSESETIYVAPQNDYERSMVQIWQELLQVEQVGINDNFFDLGGHSLLLLQVQSRLRQSLKRDVAIVDLFAYPTIAALTRHIGQVQTSDLLEQQEEQRQKRAEARREVMQRQRQLRQAHRAQK
jgi:amino acid adenylation domain-containing protein